MSWIRGFLKKSLSIQDKLVLYFFIIFVPFIIYPLSIDGATIHSRKIREICFYSFSIILCSYLQKSKWLKYFIIWCVMNWWLNFFIPRTSYIFLTNIFSALVIYIGIGKLIEIKILNPEIILKIICFSVLFQCLWMIMQMFNIQFPFYPVGIEGQPINAKMPLSGWSGNPAILGVFFSSTAFLFLEYFKIKKIPVLFFIIPGLLLFLNNAMAMVSFAGAGLFYVFNRYSFKRKSICYGIIILAVLTAFLIFIKPPNFDRIHIWKKLIFDGIRIRPFVGSGMSIFSHLAIIDKTKTPWFEAHNDYLEMILEIGIVGFILFSGFVISRFAMFFKSERNNKQICLMSCLVAFLISAFSLFPFHLTNLSFYAIIFLVILEHTYNNDEIKVLQS